MTLDFSAAQHLSHELFAALKPAEALFVEIASESSQFIRFNRARVRQIGTVEDTVVTLRLQSQQRTASTSFPYTGTADLAAALEHLAALRSETVQLPVDPYLVPPTDAVRFKTLTLAAYLILTQW